MPRRARLSFPGIPWHVIQRGNNRSACFFADEDYHLYLDHLAELSERFECAVDFAHAAWPKTRGLFPIIEE